jgi:hypothetical protein
MNRYDELSTDCQQAVDRVINTIASLRCDEKATAWLNSFRGRIMEYYNFFVPRAETRLLQEDW